MNALTCYYMDARALRDPVLFRKAAKAFLWPDRLEAVGRCRMEKDRLLLAAAGFLMAHVFQSLPAVKEAVRETGCSRSQMQDLLSISREIHGKPFLLHFPRIHFSLSHSGCYAVLSVGPSPNGADIQEAGPVSRYEKISHRFFTEQEQLIIRSSSDREQAFLRCWTRKESFLKLTGEGLTRELTGFCVLPDAPEGLQFHEKQLPAHLVTVCSALGTPFAGFWEIDPLQEMN